MRVSKRQRKQFLYHFKILHPAYSKMDKLVQRMPYQEASTSYIQRHGDKLVKPVGDYLAHQTKYNPQDSRTLSFISLKRDESNMVTLCGFVSDYKLVFNHFYHQVAIYVLLKYVAGITYGHHFKYLTDHLWIDPNLFNRIALEPVTIGQGDFVVVRGHPNNYNGHVGKLHGVKSSLDDAYIIGCGYPRLYHHKLTYQVIEYNHQQNFIYHADANCDPNVVLGNEVSKYDYNHVKGDKYYVGYSNQFNLGVIIHQGLSPSLKKQNPRLIVSFADQSKKVIKSLRWTTNQYSIRHSIVLSSVKNYQHHPKRTERDIDSRLKKSLRVSSWYLIKQLVNR